MSIVGDIQHSTVSGTVYDTGAVRAKTEQYHANNVCTSRSVLCVRSVYCTVLYCNLRLAAYGDNNVQMPYSMTVEASLLTNAYHRSSQITTYSTHVMYCAVAAVISDIQHIIISIHKSTTMLHMSCCMI